MSPSVCLCVCVCAGVLVCMCVCIGTRIYMCVCVIFAHYKMYHMHQIKPKEKPHYLINNACHIYNICVQSRLQTLPLSDWVSSKQTDFGERTLGDWVIYIILTDLVSPSDTDSGGACLCDINPADWLCLWHWACETSVSSWWCPKKSSKQHDQWHIQLQLFWLPTTFFELAPNTQELRKCSLRRLVPLKL